MSYGLALLDANSTVYYDTSIIGANYLGAFTASAGQTVTFTAPHSSLINTYYTQIFMINDLPTDQKAYTHTISIDNTTGVITATAATTGSQTTHVIVLGT